MDILNILKEGIIKHEDQGYALYFYNNGKELVEVKGKEHIEYDKKIDFNSCFRLASVSKQFIAYSIVNLINDNLLSYETTIKEVFDCLPNYFNNITI